MAALHVPMFMIILKDPVKELLNYISKQPATLPLCGIHSDGKLMSLGEKVTRILHDVYPTESDTLGMFVDNGKFSFKTDTLGKQKIAKVAKNKLIGLARTTGFALHYEHNSYDAMVKQCVDKPFQASWFEIGQKYYETGPLLVHMPTAFMGHVLANKVFQLEKEHEKIFGLKVDNALMELIDNALMESDHI